MSGTPDAVTTALRTSDNAPAGVTDRPAIARSTRRDGLVGRWSDGRCCSSITIPTPCSISRPIALLAALDFRRPTSNSRTATTGTTPPSGCLVVENRIRT